MDFFFFNFWENLDIGYYEIKGSRISQELLAGLGDVKESLRCEIHESLLRMEVRPEEREKKLFQSGSLGDCFP